MASITVGTLRALLTADTAQFEAGMRKATATTKQVDSGFSKLSSSAVGFAKTFAGAFGVGLSATALIGFTKHVLSAASDIADMAKKTGLSTEAIQRMSYVAGQTGTTLDAFTDASFKLGVRLSGGSGSVRNAAKELGLQWETLKTQSPEQQFNTIVGALGRVSDATTRNRLGTELFGKSFSGIASSVGQGYDDIAQAARVSSDAQIQAAARADDALKRLANNALAAGTTLLGNIALFQEALAEIDREDELAGTRRAAGSAAAAARLEEARRRVTLGLVGAKRDDIELTIQAGTAAETYTQQLAKVRAELARLTPTQRAEIAAAQALGVSTDNLEDKFGLSTGALRVQTASFKDSTSAIKKENEALYAAANARAELLTKEQELRREHEKEQRGERDTTLTSIMTGAEAGVEAKHGGDLSAIRATAEASERTAKVQREADLDAAQAGIEAAERHGAAWQTVYRMEMDLSKARLASAMMDEDLRFQHETESVDWTTQFATGEYNALAAEHKAIIDQMVADWKAGEAAKRGEIVATHTYTKTQMLDIAVGVANSVASSLAQLSRMHAKNKQLAMLAKAAAIGAAIMNTAQGVTKALTLLPPWSFIMAAATYAAGAIQIAAIKQTPSGYRMGTPNLDFQNFGSQTSTMLHGQEAVIPRGGGHKLADEIAVSLAGGGSTSHVVTNYFTIGGVIDAGTFHVLLRQHGYPALKQDLTLNRDGLLTHFQTVMP